MTRIFSSIEEYTGSISNLSLTIGNFDGVHLGHQSLFKQMPGNKVCLTFSNHPAEVLASFKPEKILTLDHKIRLITSYGINDLILIPFTKEFSLQSPADFLKRVRRSIPFDHLILGYDAVLGHQREGNQQFLTQLSKDMEFHLRYLPPLKLDETIISSRLIRETVRQGDLKTVQSYLGRPYSIYGKVIKGRGIGKDLECRTANISLEGLCLPPYGIYITEVVHLDKKYPSISNLGIAPTVRNTECLLETHLLDEELSLYGEEIEVQFLAYLRAEIAYPTLDELKAQIKKDIVVAKDYFSKT